jgi:hypothetical protein
MQRKKNEDKDKRLTGSHGVRVRLGVLCHLELLLDILEGGLEGGDGMLQEL